MKKGLAKVAKAIKKPDWPLAFDEALAVTVMLSPHGYSSESKLASKLGKPTPSHLKRGH